MNYSQNITMPHKAKRAPHRPNGWYNALNPLSLATLASSPEGGANASSRGSAWFHITLPGASVAWPFGKGGIPQG